jgi:hypothetical protein
MNLVALLIAPRVVEYVDNIGARLGIGLSAAVILAVAIWYSKSRRAPELASAEPPPPAVTERVEEAEV